MLRVSELEGHSIKHNLEKLKLQEDRDKLYERFREFRDKCVPLAAGYRCDEWCACGLTNRRHCVWQVQSTRGRQGGFTVVADRSGGEQAASVESAAGPAD